LAVRGSRGVINITFWVFLFGLAFFKTLSLKLFSSKLFSSKLSGSLGSAAVEKSIRTFLLERVFPRAPGCGDGIASECVSFLRKKNQF
jgi:hypothetical protein